MSDIVDTLLYAAKMAHETNVLSRLNDTDLVDAATEIRTLRSENSSLKKAIDSYMNAYFNMRDFAESKGLDTKAYSVQVVPDSQESSDE